MTYTRMAWALPVLGAGTVIASLAALGAGGPATASPRSSTVHSIWPHGSRPYKGSGPTGYLSSCAGSVLTINTASNALGPPIPLAGCPGGMAITPDGRTIYATTSGYSTVVPIATATNTLGAPIPIGDPGFSITMTPNGKTVYVRTVNTSTWATALVPISTATNRAGAPIRISGMEAIVMAPNGKSLYATTGTAVVPVSTATNKAGKPITFAAGYIPTGVATTPDGKTVYVTLARGFSGPGEVVRISTATSTEVGKPLKINEYLGGVAITPDGKTVYVTDTSDRVPAPVIAIRAATNTVTRSISIRGVRSIDGFTIAPDGKTAYATSGDQIIPLKTATNMTGSPITVANLDWVTAIAPDSKTLYAVTTSWAGGEWWSLVPVSAVTNTPNTPVPLGDTSIGTGTMVFTSR